MIHERVCTGIGIHVYRKPINQIPDIPYDAWGYLYFTVSDKMRAVAGVAADAWRRAYNET